MISNITKRERARHFLSREVRTQDHPGYARRIRDEPDQASGSPAHLQEGGAQKNRLNPTHKHASNKAHATESSLGQMSQVLQHINYKEKQRMGILVHEEKLTFKEMGKNKLFYLVISKHQDSVSFGGKDDERLLSWRCSGI